MVEKEERLTYSVEQAGRKLGLSRPSAYQAVKRGEIPVIRLGRKLLVPIVALQKMLENAGTKSGS